MILYGNLDLKGGFLMNGAFEELLDFPAEPKVGTWAFINKRFMLCVSLDDDTPFWIPLTSEMNSFVHTQEFVSTTWMIPHDLNFSTPIIQCYDGSGHVVLPSSMEVVDKDTMQVTFPDPILGRAIVVYGQTEGLAKPDSGFEMKFTNETVVEVAHGLGYEPIIQIVSDGLVVQPKSIVHDSLVLATVTFSNPQSGKVRCI